MDRAALILDSHLKRHCITDYKLEHVTHSGFGDIKLKKGQFVVIEQIYFEKEGDCQVSKAHKIELSVKKGACEKNSYTDKLEQIKTFVYNTAKIVDESFSFVGTAWNPIIKYILVTIL